MCSTYLAATYLAATYLAATYLAATYPLLGRFLAILGQSGPKRWIPGAPSGVQGIGEKGIPPIWGEVRGIWRVYLGTGGTVHPKYTLRMASDLAPCTPLGAPGIHRLGPLLAQNDQNPPKRGYPPFWPLFQEGSRNPDPIFADF